jgi:dihydroorotate dehydrogenase (NAD+) catalytic subunit
MLGKLILQVRQSVKHSTLITKLPPIISDVQKVARVAEDSGSDALSLINTVPGMVIDTETWRPKLANITGGLSGPAIRPIAVRMVWEASQAVKIPVIGIGGIMNASDAIEFMLAGATAVQVGTGNFSNPTVTVEIIDGIRQYLERKGIQNVMNIIGGVRGR